MKADYRREMADIRNRIEDLTDELKDLEMEDKIDREGDEEDFDIMKYLDVQYFKESIDETTYKILVAVGGYIVMYILVGISLDMIAIFLAEPEEAVECAEGEECPAEGEEGGGEDGEGGEEGEGDGGERRLFGLNQYYLNGPGSVADEFVNNGRSLNVQSLQFTT